MKRLMRAQNQTVAEFEFYVPDLDNLLLVESSPEAVVIRAARDNFSERRKMFFIRELAAEGFIPDEYQWSCGPGSYGQGGLAWLVDRSWIRLPDAWARRSRCFMHRLLAGSCVLWLVLMTAVFCSARGHVGPPQGNTASQLPPAGK